MPNYNYIKETIGVIGGCGVAAANELMCRIERRLTELGCADDDQQPEIILFQATHAPNRIAFAAKKSNTSFAPYFIEVGKKLKACGATICCIPCNTAHCAINEIEKEVGLPFVNIITETLKFITEKYQSAKKIGILCSSGTRISNIYQSHAKASGLDYEFVFPEGDLQDSVSQGISTVKSGGLYSSPESTRNLFLRPMNNLVAQNVDIIVLGCTEIPLAITSKEHNGTPIVDTISVLADACIERCNGSCNKTNNSTQNAGQKICYFMPQAMQEKKS